MEKAEAIIFDVYNTLLDNDTDEERQDTYAFLSLWLSYHGIKKAPSDLRRLYLDLCEEHIGRSTAPYPDIEIGNVFSEILIDRGRQPPPSKVLVSELALLFRICTTNRLAPFPGVVSMLHALKGKVKLGIASNAQRLFTIPELTRFALVNFFDAIVFSSDVGACKPGPEIFTRALMALPAEPQRTVYVGDNLLADIYGAQSVGMKAVWINRGKQRPEAGGPTPDFEANDDSSLTELLLSMAHGS